MSAGFARLTGAALGGVTAGWIHGSVGGASDLTLQTSCCEVKHHG
jgi:hypothetical protein